MNQLNSKAQQEIERLSEMGNLECEANNYPEAIRLFHQALDLLPEPLESREASTWLLAAIGDCLYLQNNFKHALDVLSDAVRCSGGLANPFIHLRLGQCHLELQNREKAIDELLRAYMGDGETIFENEPKKYFDYLKSQVKL